MGNMTGGIHPARADPTAVQEILSDGQGYGFAWRGSPGLCADYFSVADQFDPALHFFVGCPYGGDSDVGFAWEFYFVAGAAYFHGAAGKLYPEVKEFMVGVPAYDCSAMCDAIDPLPVGELFIRNVYIGEQGSDGLPEIAGIVRPCGQADPEPAVQQTVIGEDRIFAALYIFRYELDVTKGSFYRVVDGDTAIEVVLNGIIEVLHMRKSPYCPLLSGPVQYFIRRLCPYLVRVLQAQQHQVSAQGLVVEL
jgi:hypothetical protein